MDIDTGDSPPVCQKLYTLLLKHYPWEIETLDLSHQKEHQSVGPVLLLLYLRNLHLVNPPDIECALISEK